MTSFEHSNRIELSGKVVSKQGSETDSGGFIARVRIEQPGRNGVVQYNVKFKSDTGRAFDGEVEVGDTVQCVGRLEAWLYRERWAKDIVLTEYDIVDPALLPIPEKDAGDDFPEEDDIPF